ncbi:hypothetical protein CWS43_03180 [Rahnella sp. AA]|uniref:terminase small subunit n=1 Tax=Rahnella sp. AA TaxID=2057180 RepID=UPI000C336435|nr:terminase small subunit [Rahnella sp. AA]PKE32913.1 hypothetical protein CWS43_03180 [Rahnella sp. AA]
MKKVSYHYLHYDYTTTQLSLRGLGKKYGLSEGAIRKRAKAGGWVRESRYAESTQQIPNESASLHEVLISKSKNQSPPHYADFESPKTMQLNEYGLNDMQVRFVYEYLKDLNKSAAYRRAGYACSPASLYAAASRLYRNVKVNHAIQAAMKDRLFSLRLSIDDVMCQLWNIVTADPNELTQYRRVNCRECWPDNPWDPTVDPNPYCQSCAGEGVGEVFLCDTRDLSGAARSLFAGVKRTPAGAEILMHDKMQALYLLAKYAGLLDNSSKMVSDEKTLALSLILSQITPEESLDTYKKIMK